MSDPLSVAGSAVGIISLGIQVCQGLISYLQSFKSQDQDIQESLSDVQSVISILYSLKDILPKVEERSSGTPAIRRCLAESEEKLREFQQFSLKLRGTHSPEHNVLRRMDNARLALLYPFREGKLKSLCQSLKGLLQNLTLCLDITSLDVAVGIHANVDVLGNAFKDQDANVAKLYDQLQRLDNSMSAYYKDLKSEISQAHLFAEGFRQEIGGQLRLISTDIGSLMSIDRRHQEYMNQRLMEAFDELKRQNNFQNELMQSTLGVDNMYIQNTGSRQATPLARKRDPKQLTANPLGCTCERQQEYSTLSYRFWHATFEIDQPTKRIARAQFPFKLGAISSRLFLACIEYSLGTATPGISIRYRSIVPRSRSPVYDVTQELYKQIVGRSKGVTANEISLRFTEAERTILSLYRDRQTSPYDQDEDGRTHALLVYEKTLSLLDGFMRKKLAQFTVESLILSARRLIETLASTAGDENGTTMLEVAIAKSPEAVTESLYGATTVRLCLCWPEGLSRLLQTKAVDVVDEYDLQAGVDADFIESVDLLLKAGCPVNYGFTTKLIFRDASERCMDVIASNLARRRSDLLSLAQQQQVVGQDLVLTSDIPDDQASYLCSCLNNSGIIIPPALRVPSDYSTIYHFYALESYVKEYNKPVPAALCDFFHIAIQDTESSDSRISDWCIEVIRFLTFEALEMTHTCCDFAVVYRPDISSNNFNVLMKCDPERWQKIRSDKREQENAVLLEALMEEFIAYMVGMQSSPRSLEIFVNSYWRQRMSEVYSVDSDEIRDIMNCLIDTKTYVLPDRVRPLLRKGFKLIKQQDLKPELTPVGETSDDNKVELGDEPFELPFCKWCLVRSGNKAR
ncbi:uncharacterized protein FTJAE_6501 [Fusarium tjaetaba]|uniref:Azaphilone pigments biosynthesis cluster protein L N-terminal domain-containing protein n=1 Tax=Fusarium tjaetaba TaxID=1567544 RepID=A0A8H5VUQ8_9HYPO|nr:uncharacterized protein FTJAE_6501 [Fusarium tjaetaba]KAF5635118.1 hypothetical protein FTJAE_6501 [Fusarium tjaetaba]